ncbi:efflux RND transporter periplasmic adaptor subunit [Pontibacillus litoralis]|uniref:Uncharacterized protein n=1 Tax=Pontibacillus litoralis JSM 072002 TaxID=1385512 RepID=A0A0A5G0K1_9BACI|nr:efflux RND transporter periplasmic adaptor subunit [Pontibacillus litoralis]KGX85554.1 hypothetical protein N784_08580 [Pontibacillus litoralis JSM 072002]
MKKSFIIAGVVILIVATIGIGVYRQASAVAPSVKVTKIKKETLSSDIIIPGTLKLGSKHVVYPSPEQGEVKSIPVQQGDKVKKGDVLVEYENEQLDLEKQQNQTAINNSYYRINHIDKQVERLEDTKKDLQKQVGEKEAEKQIEEQREQLDLEKRTANSELEQQLLQKDMLEKRTNELTVTSDVNGTVLQRNEPESFISGESSQPIVYVGDMSDFVVEGTLSEYDTIEVKEGQSVILTSDAYPEKKWQGEVASIGTLPKQQAEGLGNESQAVQYPVEVNVTSKKMNVKPGFQLTMEIETNAKKTNTLPITAIQQDGEDYFVFIIDNNVLKKKKVEVGLTTGDKMEVVEGVTKEDKVAEQLPDNAVDGMEVTIQ